jgi:hypothetical protein
MYIWNPDFFIALKLGEDTLTFNDGKDDDFLSRFKKLKKTKKVSNGFLFISPFGGWTL